MVVVLARDGRHYRVLDLDCAGLRRGEGGGEEGETEILLGGGGGGGARVRSGGKMGRVDEGRWLGCASAVVV